MAEEGGNWLAVPFKECREERALLGHDAGVISIPTIFIVGPDGEVIAKNARDAIAADPKGENFPWEGAAASGGKPIFLALAVFIIFLFLNKFFFAGPQ